MAHDDMAVRIMSRLLRPSMGASFFLAQLFANRSGYVSDDSVLLGNGIVVAALGIMIWWCGSATLRSSTRSDRPATGGPYKYVRRPIYVGMYVLLFGLGLVFFSWWWFVVMMVFAPFWYLECRAEEEELMERYGHEYIDYMNRTRMFLPSTGK
jgi:protein-S-isoprenylcysteine O-methyltransferase Ste14